MRKGFTLVEVMIVVAIIALLAAIAIPNLLRARHNANESAAQGTLATVSKLEVSYWSVNSQYATLVQLIADNPPYIDQTVDDATGKQGYIFEMVGNVTAFSYCVSARPVDFQRTGTRSFCATEDGVVRSAINAGNAPADRATCSTWNPTGN